MTFPALAHWSPPRPATTQNSKKLLQKVRNCRDSVPAQHPSSIPSDSDAERSGRWTRLGALTPGNERSFWTCLLTYCLETGPGISSEKLTLPLSQQTGRKAAKPTNTKLWGAELCMKGNPAWKL